MVPVTQIVTRTGGRPGGPPAGAAAHHPWGPTPCEPGPPDRRQPESESDSESPGAWARVCAGFDSESPPALARGRIPSADSEAGPLRLRVSGRVVVPCHSQAEWRQSRRWAPPGAAGPTRRTSATRRPPARPAAPGLTSQLGPSDRDSESASDHDDDDDRKPARAPGSGC